MDMATINSNDEITMRLVHFLVTKEGYHPMIIAGIDNEVWLENTDKRYELIRISSNYIHNNEQFEMDLRRMKSIAKQINKKTFSFKAKSINILLNVGENVSKNYIDDKVDIYQITSIDDLTKSESFMGIFPEFKSDNVNASNAMDFLMNVTYDINKKNEQVNKTYSKIFSIKFPLITYILIAINVLVFILSNILNVLDVNMFYSGYTILRSGEYYRIITSAFFHGSILHLICNMYALFILGTQAEMFFGKLKYSIIYLFSIIFGSLMSAVVNGAGITTIGASGAIFGLMGCLLLFGYNYRNYLGSFLTKQLLPVIVLNLMLGFALSYVDNYAHIGGLVGGLFITMAVGMPEKENDDRISGIITSIILLGFLIYMLFFR